MTAFEMLLIFVGLFMIGVAFLAAFAKTSGVSGNRIDHRKEFFRLVETAREAEILEKKPVIYDVSGNWKGEGDGYFGIGRNIQLEISQNQSELTGRIIDHFGYSQFRGFFVWPYLWFDFERHGTVFEFRGIIKELPDGAAIAGRYRYFQDDADWSVKRQGVPLKKAPLAVSETAEKEENVKPAVATVGDTSTKAEQPAAENEVPEAVAEEIQPVPTGDGTEKSTYQRGSSGKCPDCGSNFEEILSFCIYCGKKKE